MYAVGKKLSLTFRAHPLNRGTPPRTGPTFSSAERTPEYRQVPNHTKKEVSQSQAPEPRNTQDATE